MTRSRAAAVPFILVVLFLDTLGIGVVLPVLPRLIASFVHGDLADGSRWFGWFGAVYAAMQLFWAPLVGALSDRFGRRPPQILTSCSSARGSTTCSWPLRAEPGVALRRSRVRRYHRRASFSAATAYIVDVTPVEERSKALGLAGAALALGFICGPAIGGLVGDVHLRAPFLVAAGLNLLNLAYGAVVLPESLSREHRRPIAFGRANPFGALKALGQTPTLPSGSPARSSSRSSRSRS